MTTKFLDNNILTLKILLSLRFPRKIAFWTIFLSAPLPTPPEKRKCYFYCRLAFSELQNPELQKATIQRAIWSAGGQV